MDQPKRTPTIRPRRPRSIPPTPPRDSVLPLPDADPEEEVPRFRGQQAALAALAVQIRRASTPLKKANAAARLARQLIKRGIELREAIGLAEKALCLGPNPELASDLASWWVDAGETSRGAALRQTSAAELSPERQKEECLEVARLYARAGRIPQTIHAIRAALEAVADDGAALEFFGSLGFWTDLPAAECSRAFLRAAKKRESEGNEGGAFENLLRAFEVDPTCGEAATALANSLRARGRGGAADEIQREFLRHGSAAQRVAFHQRNFYRALGEKKYALALESALEAELDVELDPARLSRLLLEGGTDSASDFEGMLLLLITDKQLGDANLFATWLLALVESHLFDWGEVRVRELRDELEQFLLSRDVSVSESGACKSLFAQYELPKDEQTLRELRRKLVGGDVDPDQGKALRCEIAFREAARGAWAEAYEAFEPLLVESEPQVHTAALGAFIAGRARHPSGRARAFLQLGRCMEGRAQAVPFVVAAEQLLTGGAVEEAREAAAFAVDLAPNNERALSCQALVAMHAPEGVSIGLLERSLSVLVARAEACSHLRHAANERGSYRLGLTWAVRAAALRPGELKGTQEYLRQALLTEDTDKVIEALTYALSLGAPFAPLAEEVADALRSLRGVAAETLEGIGRLVLRAVGPDCPEVMEALTETARSCGADRLIAYLTERPLVICAASERAGLSLALCRQRLTSEEPVAAARALRRALSQGAEHILVEEALRDFPTELEPDAELALLEIGAELRHPELQDDARTRAVSLRRVAAARFDMTQDAGGAIQLLLKAAELEPENGLELLAHYLHHLLGPEAAALQLERIADQTEDALRSGHLLGFAAKRWFKMGASEKAYRLAIKALERAPSLTELLAIVESCVPLEEVSNLPQLYAALAFATVGNYGERAVHYRAARQLEKRGMLEKAFEHACSAFRAVPAEGVTFLLMARLADTASSHGQMVSALEAASVRADSDNERVRWLAKAAAYASPDSKGRREKVEILFRTVRLAPEHETLKALLDALKTLFENDPSVKNEFERRFARLAEESLRFSSGAYGAQLAILFSKGAVTQFNSVDLGLSCLKAAISQDIEVPEYESLLLHSEMLAQAQAQARQIVEQVSASVQDSVSPLGGALARLSGELAQRLDEPELHAQLLVRAASDFPEDIALVTAARFEAQSVGRHDLLEQMDGLLPVSVRAESLLNRIAELSAEEGLDALYQLDLDAANDSLRVQLLSAIAERQEALQQFDDAVGSFREFLELEPGSDVALRGLERAAIRSENDEELVRLLGLRMAATSDRQLALELGLRRARVLEFGLGRAAESRTLLSAIVDETENETALKMLAHSWTQSGDQAEAGELWLRIQKLATRPEDADEAAFRAATSFVDAGADHLAEGALALIKTRLSSHEELALCLARRTGDAACVHDSLIALADSQVDDSASASSLFLEAARTAISEGNHERALQCSRRAAQVNPHCAEARLLEMRVLVQNRGMETVAEANEVMEALEGTEEIEAPSSREVAAYLRARGLSIVQSASEARLSLEAAISKQGQKGLLLLALADLTEDDDEQALSLYESALGTELYGFSSEGELLLKAGQVARKLGDFSRAKAFVSAVADDDPNRVAAARELELLAQDQLNTANLNDAKSGLEPDVGDPSIASANDRVAQQEVAVSYQQRQEREVDEREAIRIAARAEHRKASQAVVEQVESAGPFSIGERLMQSRVHKIEENLQEEHSELSPSILEAATVSSVSAPTVARPTTRRPPLTDRSEEALIQGLEKGDIDAGLELLARVQDDRSRTRDALVVAQHLVALDPGDASLLGRLVSAASRDGNEALALAVRHVLGAYGAGDRVTAPEIESLVDQGSVASSLLFRAATSPLHEALSIVWEHAASLYKKDLSDYGLAGVERIPLSDPSTTGELYRGASRVLGMSRTAVFKVEGEGDIAMQVALLVPPSVVVSGHLVDDAPELRFHFGAMLAAAGTGHALLYGLASDEMQNLLEALALSFGAGRAGAGSRPDPEITRVASYFWETIPSRAQRRLTQICSDSAVLDAETLAESSRRVLRRAGLLVCGDLPTAIADACGESGLDVPRNLAELASCAARSGAVADLLGLAISPEYAELRFLEGR